MEEEKPKLSTITFEYVQESATEGDMESLRITYDVMISDRDGEGYYIIRTPYGWSFNTPDELMDLLVPIQEAAKIVDV
jgi:hypothetical protein